MGLDTTARFPPYDLFKSYVMENDKKYGTDFAGSIWSNEVGFPTVGEGTLESNGWEGQAVQNEDSMPESVAKTLAVIAASGSRQILWYQMFDDRQKRDGFGLVWAPPGTKPESWERKGGYWGFALVAKTLPGMKLQGTNFFPVGNEPNRFRSLLFVEEGGKGRVLLAWNDHLSETRDLTVRLGSNTSNRKLWNVDDGTSGDLKEESGYKLYPVNNGERTMVFMTWDEEN